MKKVIDFLKGAAPTIAVSVVVFVLLNKLMKKSEKARELLS